MTAARFFRPQDEHQWDEFCAGSYNATFLHTRRFLSYHRDRFVDRSVVLENERGWQGIMPAADHPSESNIVVSHAGITYGGIVHRGNMRGAAMLDALRASARLLTASDVAFLHYKAVPHIYHRAPAQDDLYALQQLGARRYRCDLSSCIDLVNRLPVSERRRRSLKKAARSGLTLESGREVAQAVWQVLEDNLARRHGVRPTHALEEILTLADGFPAAISFHAARLDGEVVAGIVLFRSPPVVHVQYIASSEMGNSVSALDAIFESCIADATVSKARYFDFGISTEEGGTLLNDSLYTFKCEFGGSGLVHEFYEVDLRRIA